MTACLQPAPAGVISTPSASPRTPLLMRSGRRACAARQAHGVVIACDSAACASAAPAADGVDCTAGGDDGPAISATAAAPAPAADGVDCTACSDDRPAISATAAAAVAAAATGVVVFGGDGRPGCRADDEALDALGERIEAVGEARLCVCARACMLCVCRVCVCV